MEQLYERGLTAHAFSMAQDTPRDRLTREVDEITARIATMTTDLHAIFDASVDSNADDEHDPEGQTIGYERAQLTALITAAQAQLTAVERALTRLEEGSWRDLHGLPPPIPAERLEVRPAPRRASSTHPGRGEPGS